MLEVRQLVKRFGAAPALDGVALDVEDGEICAVVGPNGAGKTTLLRIVAGCLPATAGRVVVGGVDAVRAPLEARRLTGFLPEGCPLYADLRVDEHLRYRGRLKGLRGRRLRARMRHVVAQCDLGDVQHHFVERLSLGQRRRVGLADALLTEPRLLLLDEPFAALDPQQVEATCDWLKSLTRHTAVLLATQRLDLVARLCRRMVVLNRGRVAAVHDVASASAPIERLFLAAVGGDRVKPVAEGRLP